MPETGSRTNGRKLDAIFRGILLCHNLAHLFSQGVGAAGTQPVVFNNIPVTVIILRAVHTFRTGVDDPGNTGKPGSFESIAHAEQVHLDTQPRVVFHVPG